MGTRSYFEHLYTTSPLSQRTPAHNTCFSTSTELVDKLASGHINAHPALDDVSSMMVHGAPPVSSSGSVVNGTGIVPIIVNDR